MCRDDTSHIPVSQIFIANIRVCAAAEMAASTGEMPIKSKYSCSLGMAKWDSLAIGYLQFGFPPFPTAWWGSLKIGTGQMQY